MSSDTYTFPGLNLARIPASLAPSVMTDEHGQLHFVPCSRPSERNRALVDAANTANNSSRDITAPIADFGKRWGMSRPQTEVITNAFMASKGLQSVLDDPNPDGSKEWQSLRSGCNDPLEKYKALGLQDSIECVMYSLKKPEDLKTFHQHLCHFGPSTGRPANEIWGSHIDRLASQPETIRAFKVAYNAYEHSERQAREKAERDKMDSIIDGFCSSDGPKRR